MNEIFNIKRTKMIDEATLGHKPTNLGKSLLIFLLVFIIADTVQSTIFSIPGAICFSLNIDYVLEHLNDDFSNLWDVAEAVMPAWMNIVALFSTVGIILSSIVYCRVIEKRKISSMGLRKNGAVKEYLIGMVAGFVMFGIAITSCVATGSATIGAGANINVLYIIFYFFGFLIQGAAEELLCRGYFMTSLARDYAPSVAISVSAVTFSLLHINNTGFGILPFINILLFGVFLGIYVFKRGNIWGACAIHSIWNFAQGNIFGTSVSGGEKAPSIFDTSFVSGRAILTGGDFGPEGGLCVTVVLLIAICISLFVMKTNKNELSYTEMTSENIA